MNPPLPGVKIRATITVRGTTETPPEATPDEEAIIRRTFSSYLISALSFQSPNSHLYFEGVTILLDNEKDEFQPWNEMAGSIEKIAPGAFRSAEGDTTSSQAIFVDDVIKSNANEWKLKFKTIRLINPR